MQKTKKIMMIFLLSFSSMASIALIGYSVSKILMEKTTTITTSNKLIGWTREDETNSEGRYLKDALLNDAIEKANTDSVLFYKITTNGVITRFSFVAHVMKVLELNPNKTIRIFAIKALNLDIEYFKQFKNVEFNYFDESLIETYVKYDFNVEFLESVYKEFGPNTKIDGYLDDYSYMEKILLYLKGINSPIYRLQIYDEFALFSKLQTINFFSDGTKSVEYFSETIKKAFLLSGNLYDQNQKNYVKAKNIREGVRNETIDKKEFIEGNNALLFLTSLITADFSDINKGKYFLPTTDFIGEVNRPDGNNFKDGRNDVFSPYNSLNLNVIEFIRTLNQKDIKKIMKISETFDPKYYIDQMNGFDNYIYAGTLLDTPDRVKNNIETLLAIKKYAETDTSSQNPNKIRVWFKGHPRDKDIEKKLRDAIIELTSGQDDGSWIMVLDHTVPFEFYSIFDVFSPDPINNKKVFVFTTYSTLVLMMYAAQLDKEITKIIIDNSSLYSYDKIVDLYGKDSKIFPSDKLTTLEEFRNPTSPKQS